MKYLILTGWGLLGWLALISKEAEAIPTFMFITIILLLFCLVEKNV